MDCSGNDAMGDKEMTMNPLANTDLQTYLRNLVDRHMPDWEDGHGKEGATHPETLDKPSDDSDDMNPPSTDAKKQADGRGLRLSICSSDDAERRRP